MVALREEVPVNSITLFILGGVAHIANEPPTPRSEFRIVLAGPLASMFLGGVFKLFSMMAFLGPQVTASALYLYQINVILALFNMIPGFPLDGGRVLRSFLWKLKDDFYLATRWASHTGLGIALLFVVAGIALMLTGNLVSGLWMAFIGWYLSTAAQEGFRQAAEIEPSSPAAGSIDIDLARPQVSSSEHVYQKPCRKELALVRVVAHPHKLPFAAGDQKVHDAHPRHKLRIE
jgi:Zn-dependent protease